VKRREFITLIGGAASSWPFAARAQQSDGIPRIGVLMPFAKDHPEAPAYIAALQEELQKRGWTLGRKIHLDLRWATSDAKAIQSVAKELVLSQPDLVLSLSTSATAAVLQETRTIPIVFVQVTDPVGSGFVASIARPGGTATGFITGWEPTMAGKWLEMLKEVAPRVARVAIIFNPTTAPYAEYYLSSFKAAAALFGIEGVVAAIRDPSELESVLAAQASAPNTGLVVMPDPFMVAHHSAVPSLVARYRLPTISPYRFYTERGCLLSYGHDITDIFRHAADYADRILRGAKPGELPVQAPVKFDLVINLKAAKALELDVPWHLQQRADKVIE